MFENVLQDVKTYNELIEKLKILGVTPKEAYSLAFKSKFNYDRRHFWTMLRITDYLRSRMVYALNLKSKYNVEVKYPKKLWRLYHKELKEEKWYNEKVMGGPIPNLKKTGQFWKTLWYVDPAYWADLINAVLENKEIIKLIKTKMLKKIVTCRKLMQAEPAEFEYNNWWPGKKYDAYQEALNLHKLVTEKRHRYKFSPSYLDIRKAPNWDKIKWQTERSKKKEHEQEYKWWHEESKKIAKRMRETIPDYAKSTYKWDDPKPDDPRYVKVYIYLLKHDAYGGKVNNFKYFTKRNINLIR